MAFSHHMLSVVAQRADSDMNGNGIKRVIFIK